MKKTKTNIIVNQPIFNEDKRTIQIEGFYDDIAECLYEINKLLSEIEPKDIDKHL